MSDFRYMDRVRARENGAPLALPEPERPFPPVSQTSSGLARVMGGSPLAVLARLIVLSFVVGAALAWLDIRPIELLWWIESLARRLWAYGFDGLREGMSYVLLGAVIVVPLWLLSRLFGKRA